MGGMLPKRDVDGGVTSSPGQGLGLGRYVCENLGELCWKGFKGGAGIVLCCWTFYVFFLMLTTHPCWQSSGCWEALVIGSGAGRHVSRSNCTSNSTSASAGCFGNDESLPTGLEHVVFGIAGSARKWKQRKGYVDLWWQPGRTRGYVWLDSRQPWPSYFPPYKISENTSRFNYTHAHGLRSAIRISRIVSETFRLGLPNVRWFVMGDDDTVFFPKNLIRVLSKYDHKQYYYIGSNSECTEQNLMHSYGMAFGGGGFAISYPLAKALESMQDGCLQRYANLYGSDQRVHACLAELGVPLTREPGFHQVDIHGDLFGLLAAHPIAPLVSLHHLDSVAPIFPNMSRIDALGHLMQAASVDSGRLLQQSICYDKRRKWTISVSWGYAVQVFDRIELPRLLEYPLQTFVTWKNSGKFPFSFNTRPLSKNPCDRPTIFFMQNIVRKSGSKHIVSTYAKGATGLSNGNCSLGKDSPNAVQLVRVVSDTMTIDWKQAPRRQCCDLVSFSTKKGMEIRIRSCRDGEAISPP